MKTKEQTTETKSLFKSLASFQQEVPVIHKETKGYGYSYADLPTIFNIINPLLAKHQLGFTQPIMGDCVKTIVFHVETGETLESLINIPKEVELKGMNDYQILGSAITYIRRYALSSILGLVTDKDTDASKPELTIEHENFLKVVEYIRNGGTMDEVRKKYRVSNEIENHIKKLL
jgi:hypothetical protein